MGPLNPFKQRKLKMKRYRNDSVKPGKGIDGTEGENFTKAGRVSPWDSNPKGNDVDERGANVYQDKNADFLRTKMPSDQSGGVGTRDIWSEVEGQSSDSGNRAVKSRGQP
jgi:hypothetical protein